MFKEGVTFSVDFPPCQKKVGIIGTRLQRSPDKRMLTNAGRDDVGEHG